MDVESKELFTCDVCDEVFSTAGALTKHTQRASAHDGLRRNAMNEIVFACNVCDKAYSSQRKLRCHRYYAKHTLPDSTGEPSMDDIECMEEPSIEENIYSSDGRIRNKISQEKERVIIFSISFALGNVQDAVKRAFRSVRDEMIPLYSAASSGSVEHMDAWERVGKVLAPFENGLLMTLMQDTFNVTKELKNDLESL